MDIFHKSNYWQKPKIGLKEVTRRVLQSLHFRLKTTLMMERLLGRMGNSMG